MFFFLFIDDFNALKCISILNYSTDNHAILFSMIQWKSTPLFIVDEFNIQPPPLCGPTNNITKYSVMACLERSGNVDCGSSIHVSHLMPHLLWSLL